MKRAEIIRELQTDILRLQGLKPSRDHIMDIGLGPIARALPNGSFPLASIHEFLLQQPEDAAATSGFIAGLLSPVMGEKGMAMWISTSRTLFPPALKSFGIEPDRFIFIDLTKEADLLWAMEEALRCEALTAVIGELNNMDFTASRRLQLAVEQSQVTGFVLSRNLRMNPTASVSRWRITSLPSVPISVGGDELPGVGSPQWHVELLKIKNGKPGAWTIRWTNGAFHAVEEKPALSTYQNRKTG